ncbi:hypothetical protein UFOVP137_28 [uncultured Caudovirales phage]|uniref:Uncharacterized protein n=1 Tax=uncultured Caudovirales phage TaxID=2100421 RepID=A0A6J5LG33_9CAUD|nr:hypothetical protein UFOVP137_28 [uncultured Caudovirales phage]
MVNLKEIQEHREAEYSQPSMYSYGTSIDLDGEVIEALGLNGQLAAGQKVTIQAIGVVVRRSEELEAGDDSGGKDTNVCIQLTDIDVKQSGKPNTQAAATMLYGDDD